VPVQAAPDAFWQRFGDRVRACPPPAGWDGREIAEEAMRGRWDMLGEIVEVQANLDWSQRVGRPLHSFHLQYHEPLRALARHADQHDDALALRTIGDTVSRWIETTQRGGGDAWHPYPISVRVFVWLEVLALVGTRLPDALRQRMLTSLASQLDVLARRRERQIGANHLQRNDAALALGGLAFTGPAAARWRAIGLGGLQQALRHHVMGDGMHYERTPMYHAGMLADVLRVMECCQVAGVAMPPAALERVPGMVRALQWMTRADGTLHHFNDTAAGIAPPTAWLVQRAAAAMATAVPPVPDGRWSLPEAGYAGWVDSAAGIRIVFDAGLPGPREQPGHAHCDALSFELCLDGGPVLVNAGVHGYDGDPYREYSRSTRGHNTVQIGSREQHEVWSTFRVARFGAVTGPAVDTAGAWTVSGTVAAYTGGSHVRRLELRDRDTLRIEDTITGPRGETAVSRLLFHPDFTVTTDGTATVGRRGRRWVRLATEPAGERRLVTEARSPAEGWYFPTFGRARPACCVATLVSLPSAPLVTTITWGTD
jgi:uncharacterized heparinase superfamily protein